MSLSSHVVSLDLALALRDAGYPQEPYIYKWFLVDGKRHVLLNHDEFMRFKDFESSLLGQAVAPLSSEIMEQEIMNGYVLGTTWFKDEEQHAVCNWYETNSAGVAQVNAYQAEAPYARPCYGKTLPNAAAKTWLHLRKASLI